ncbi:MAG: hypothetical protein JW860_06465 [Sedimentisphaerales bacterium]|nr:hypothetical protein [Sedimentisphaerales bacterium]
MIGTKRIVYLFSLLLIIGLILVHLRTRHMQAVYEMVTISEQQQQLRHKLWQQQILLSGVLETPEKIKKKVQELNVDLVPPGNEENQSDQE